MTSSLKCALESVTIVNIMPGGKSIGRDLETLDLKLNLLRAHIQ